VALLNKEIFYILKCTVLNFNNISTKDFLEDIKFINGKKCDNLTIVIIVNNRIFSCYIINLFFCSETNALFNTAKFHDGSWGSSTELEKLE
jgi:hypothetical protein